MKIRSSSQPKTPGTRSYYAAVGTSVQQAARSCWACTSGRTNAASRAMLSGEVPCEIQMDADDGINAEFDIKDYQIFFDLMGAKQR